MVLIVSEIVDSVPIDMHASMTLAALSFFFPRDPLFSTIKIVQTRILCKQLLAKNDNQELAVRK